METSTLHFIGLYHGVECKTAPGLNLTSHQQQYRELIDKWIPEVTFLAEEAGDYEADSYVKPIALKRQIVYRNIDIPTEAKEKVRYCKMQNDDLSDNSDNAYARAWNTVREWHMIDVVQELLRIHEGESGLVIIGLQHLDSCRRHLERHATLTASIFYPLVA